MWTYSYPDRGNRSGMSMDVFVARQPIFDRQRNVYAYELLFRSGWDNFFNPHHADLSHASTKVIADSVLSFGGVESITGNKKAFINVTRDVLLKEHVNLLPKEFTVVELLEEIVPDPEVLAACQKLKSAGYLLALDDFVYAENLKPLILISNIIKVDFLQTVGPERQSLLQRFAPLGIKFLAEKVETQEEYQSAFSMGYDYFQGYFFSKPLILQGKDIPGFKLNYLRILQEINRPELDFEQIEGIIKRDVALSYKLLRYINSPFFGWRREISSIKHALALLGDRNFKKWASLMALSSMGQDKPAELVINAMVRAKLCEAIAPKVDLKHREQDLFLLGMFSLLDALVDRPLTEILAEIPIAEDVKRTLLGERGGPFADVYQTVIAYEKGDWENFSKGTALLKLDENEIPKLYIEALDWANSINMA
jgi:EAL and modified HD-GYP domain-containing signal transduction protein